MKAVFFGTPDYVLPVIERLYKKISSSDKSAISAVVTQSPKPVGRDKKITYSPVDAWAYKRKISIFYPPSRNTAGVLRQAQDGEYHRTISSRIRAKSFSLRRDSAPDEAWGEDTPTVSSGELHNAADLAKEGIKAELGVLAAYGEMIPESVIKLFPQGILNIHPSFLPLYRGASPVQAAIVSGEGQTGVTIIKLDSEMDHGPIVSQFKEDILPQDTTGSLRARLFERGAEVLVELIESYLKGKISPRAQEHTKATFTTHVTKEHGFIPPKYLSASLNGSGPFKERWQIPFIKNFSITPSSTALYNFIRAMDPWPISWTLVQLNSKSEARNTKRLKILKAHLEKPLTISRQPLIIDEVQLEGKNPVSWKEFTLGYPNAKLEEV